MINDYNFNSNPIYHKGYIIHWHHEPKDISYEGTVSKGLNGKPIGTIRAFNRRLGWLVGGEEIIKCAIRNGLR